MKGLIDIHTHNVISRKGSSLISIGIDSDLMENGKYYSIGLHPWEISKIYKDDLDALSNLLTDCRVLALGECGIDSLKGPSMDIQEAVFIDQVKLSEIFKKPLIIHQVKSIDRIIRIKKELKPTQNWLIHGFRGGPEQASQLMALNVDLSFGLNYNINTIKSIPLNRLFIESDVYPDITDIYKNISDSLSIEIDKLYNIVALNVDGFLKTSLFAL